LLPYDLYPVEGGMRPVLAACAVNIKKLCFKGKKKLIILEQIEQPRSRDSGKWDSGCPE
jgi:hypothetical protein